MEGIDFGLAGGPERIVSACRLDRLFSVSRDE
jgi:hypothetical protein